jgi:TetR/AcrR family tetracycline transcriptional repressor
VATTRATKERLSRETVTERALALADAEGIDAVTIRRLATDLGVTPMALYWHFQDKERLLDGVSELVLSQIRLPADDEERPWEERLREVLDQLLAVLAAHPATTDVVKTRILQSEPGLQLTERALALLREGGFSAEQAAQRAVYALVFIVGLVTGEPGAMPGTEDRDAREERLRGKWAALQALSPKRYPHILEAAGPLTGCDDSDEWRAAGMDLLLRGLRAPSAPAPPSA